jgi:Tol biopolymer transport system component
MAETKQLLERAKRAFNPPTDVMDALVVRRDRKRRDQRVRAGVLGLAIAIAVGWLGVVAIRSTPPVPGDPPDLPSTPESWSRVRLDPPIDGGEGPSFLVAGPDRLAAVGVHGGPATAWTSSDGATWTRTASEDLDRADIFDIRSGGPGFIATGSAVPEGDFERAIWTSEDGVSWNRLPDNPVFGDTLFISAVAPGGPGLVAVGSHLGAWYSSDGSAWERASVPTVPPEVYPGDDGETPQIYLTDVADREGRLVATGWAMLNDNSEVVVVWTSRDGRSWTDVPTQADVFPPGSFISEITAGPDGFVAVGHIDTAPDMDAVGQVSTAIWYSPDGRDWRLHRPGPDGLQLYSVAAGDGGYVAVGTTTSCTTTDCASREAVVMTSVDGQTWVRVPSGPEFRVAEPANPEKAQGAAMFQVVAWGSRFAAVGEYDGEPTVWVTAPRVEEEVTTPPLPDVRRDGEVISNALAYGVDGDVFLAHADGSKAVRIADGFPDAGSYECAPGEHRASYEVFGTAWSPDGRYLAYWDRGCPDPWGTVIISDAEGNVISSFPGQAWAISWSPDSTRVAVMDDWATEGGATIGVYGIDGTRQAALPVPEESLNPGGDYSPVWSQDGSSILVPDVQVPLDGGAPTPLPEELNRGFGVYSPDGSRFAYLDRGTLVVDDADGSDAQKAAGPGEFWYVAWSPNGDLVAFEGLGGTQLLVRDVAAGTDTSLVDVKRPERLHVIEFSPDGDRILFTRSDADGGNSLWSIGLDGSDPRRLLAGIGWADLRPQGQPS